MLDIREGTKNLELFFQSLNFQYIIGLWIFSFVCFVIWEKKKRKFMQGSQHENE
jgi:hypothetical protein